MGKSLTGRIEGLDWMALADAANRWAQRLRLEERFPSRLSEYRLRCPVSRKRHTTRFSARL